VAGSPAVVRAETAQQGLRSPEKRQTRSDPSQGGEEGGLAILPAQDLACRHGRVLEKHREQAGRPLLVRDQQAAMWARVKEATKKGKQKWRVGDLLADERCSPAVLDFLRSAHVGRAAPPVEENWDSEDEAEEAEVARREEQAE